MSKSKKIDLIILLIYPIFAVLISHLFKVNLFWSMIVFFGVPSMYLTIRGWKFVKRVAIFPFVFIPAVIVQQYIAHVSKQWLLSDSILPNIFESISIEVILWLFLNLYLIIIFYEYFLHHHFLEQLWHPRMKYLLIFVLIIFVLFLYFYNFNPDFLHISRFYLYFTIFFALIPVTLQFLKYPKFISKFFETAAYFFYFTLTYEITALQLDLWSFPSDQFIGWVSIWNIRFPVEELLFWMILCAMAVLTYYEFFDSGEK